MFTKITDLEIYTVNSLTYETDVIFSSSSCGNHEVKTRKAMKFTVLLLAQTNFVGY